ncbi:transcriptional regulator [Saccharopolyspora erythraea]|uniref:transcriptional regulator GutM n=1 Tax=Saccharopolyspora erythraea TaxID=1836 RepID=UPI001BACC413|nr:transcriptional regulator GutM [Saccharopolyspora erythraea]QUH04133.1 transcriptional regulator [Saccharopolyspora erythraea]
MSWALIGVAVMIVVSTGLAWVQQRAYQQKVNTLVTQERQDGRILVSGRAKGKVRGAIVLLVIDRRSSLVHRAVGMAGASVFARFHELPQLIGPLAGAGGRAPSRAVRRATEDAIERYSQLRVSSKPVPH